MALATPTVAAATAAKGHIIITIADQDPGEPDAYIIELQRLLDSTWTRIAYLVNSHFTARDALLPSYTPSLPADNEYHDTWNLTPGGQERYRARYVRFAPGPHDTPQDPIEAGPWSTAAVAQAGGTIDDFGRGSVS